MASKFLDRFSSPVAKLVRFFERSRDGWKAKHREVKEECKKLANQVRAVENSRERWRERTRTAERRLAELEREIEALKFRGRPAAYG
jgi:predicted  nucleic acid-binding Zn-ribbon protein